MPMLCRLAALALALVAGGCLDWEALSRLDLARGDRTMEARADAGADGDRGPTNCVVYCCDGYVWSGRDVDNAACHATSQSVCATRGNVLKHLFDGLQTYSKDPRCWGKCGCHSEYSDMSKVDLDKDGLPDYPGLTSADCKPKVQEWCGKLGCSGSTDQWAPCNPSGGV